MRSLPIHLVAVAALILLAGCSSGKIPLSYRFDEGEGTRYRWTIDSETSVSSTTEESVTTLNMVIDVNEKVTRRRGDQPAMLTIELTPRTLSRGTQSLELPEPVTVRYELGQEGQIVEALTEDLAPQAASALQLGATLIGTRIALPSRPVGIGDEWDTPFVLDGDLGNINLSGHGKLLGFELKGKRKLARIETKRSGDILTHEQQGGTPVRLKGTSTSDAMSSLDVDSGVLYNSNARLLSDFDIASVESGKLLGTMRVALNSKLELDPEQAS
jgi:hypothetical protein